MEDIITQKYKVADFIFFFINGMYKHKQKKQSILHTNGIMVIKKKKKENAREEQVNKRGQLPGDKRDRHWVVST